MLSLIDGNWQTLPADIKHMRTVADMYNTNFTNDTHIDMGSSYVSTGGGIWRILKTSCFL
jgi:hypothetical protein